MPDPYDIQRFVDAQAPIIDQAVAELEAGRKRSHWMWFVFPQIAGLGASAMAQRYALHSLDEANTYLAHDRLGPRLGHCTDLVNRVEGRSIAAIFGSPDDMKFRSSMTLFSRAAPEDERYRMALARYFGGEPDRATLDRL